MLGAALAAPEWLPLSWSREDGPIENAGFACFVVGAALATYAGIHLRTRAGTTVVAAALALVLAVAAGEEVSWGQRWLDIETPTALVDGNRQDELNLHNLEEFQSKAIYAQLGVAVGGLLAARTRRWRWARVGVPCFAAYLTYRAGRVLAVALGWGPSGRNAEAAEVFLAVGLLLVAWRLGHDTDGEDLPEP